jgi:hypothetical protein
MTVSLLRLSCRMPAHRARMHEHTHACDTRMLMSVYLSRDLVGVGYVAAAVPGFKVGERIGHLLTLLDHLVEHVGVRLANYLCVCAVISVFIAEQKEQP